MCNIMPHCLLLKSPDLCTLSLLICLIVLKSLKGVGDRHVPLLLQFSTQNFLILSSNPVAEKNKQYIVEPVMPHSHPVVVKVLH